jgi:hypothetical protein
MKYEKQMTNAKVIIARNAYKMTAHFKVNKN